MAEQVDLKIISLNVRGLGNNKKRVSVFRWLKNQKADIVFLQECHKTEETEHLFKREWNGQAVFSHGTSQSRGVAILMQNNLDVIVKDEIYKSPNGRLLILDVSIKDSNFKLVNLYAPNIEGEQIAFYNTVKNVLKRFKLDAEENIIMGGDFNIIFDPELEKKEEIWM